MRIIDNWFVIVRSVGGGVIWWGVSPSTNGWSATSAATSLWTAWARVERATSSRRSLLSHSWPPLNVVSVALCSLSWGDVKPPPSPYQCQVAFGTAGRHQKRYTSVDVTMDPLRRGSSWATAFIYGDENMYSAQADFKSNPPTGARRCGGTLKTTSVWYDTWALFGSHCFSTKRRPWTSWSWSSAYFKTFWNWTKSWKSRKIILHPHVL